MLSVGSTNQVKIQAVEEVILDYPLLHRLPLHSFSVPSEIADQPLSLDETIRGAKNRAKHAFAVCQGCIYSFGIESGLMEVAEASSGFMEVTICTIFDGTRYFLGKSCGFELPPSIIELVLKEKLDLCQACFKIGFSNNPQLGMTEGAIGILTKGRILRKDNTKQAIMTALIQIENNHLYSSSI